MRRLGAKAILLVRDNRFADVNRIAGPPGPGVKQVMAALEAMPEAADVARILHPPPPATSGARTLRQPGSGPR